MSREIEGIESPRGVKRACRCCVYVVEREEALSIEGGEFIFHRVFQKVNVRVKPLVPWCLGAFSTLQLSDLRLGCTLGPFIN